MENIELSVEENYMSKTVSLIVHSIKKQDWIPSLNIGELFSLARKNSSRVLAHVRLCQLTLAHFSSRQLTQAFSLAPSLFI